MGHCQIFYQSSQIEVSIGSDFPGLMVKKCGQRFLYHQDVEEFEQTIIKCSTVPFYNMELINQSLASDSPNDKPKNEAGCSYEDPNLGRLRRPFTRSKAVERASILKINILIINSAKVIYR